MTGNGQKKTSKRSRRSRRGPGSSQVSPAVKPHTVVALKYPSQALGIYEAAAGAGVSYTFSVNSIFDPDFSGSGNQPIGMDQWAQFYGRYRVLKFRYKIYMVNLSSTVKVMAGIYFSPQSTMPANPTSWMAQPDLGGKTRAVVLSAQGGGRDVATLSGSARLCDVFGVTQKEYTAEMDFAALVTNSPARQAYMHIWCLGDGSAIGSIKFYGVYEYDTELSQPVALNVS